MEVLGKVLGTAYGDDTGGLGGTGGLTVLLDLCFNVSVLLGPGGGGGSGQISSSSSKSSSTKLKSFFISVCLSSVEALLNSFKPNEFIDVASSLDVSLCQGSVKGFFKPSKRYGGGLNLPDVIITGESSSSSFF